MDSLAHRRASLEYDDHPGRALPNQALPAGAWLWVYMALGLLAPEIAYVPPKG